MISEIYAIFDEASEAFVQFIPCVNEMLARRTFESMFKNKLLKVPMIYDYPESFKVYKLASFDDNLGVFENTSHHEFLLDFGSLIN